MVVLHKDGGERRLGPLLGALLAETLPRVRPRPWDAVTFVPASRAARQRRGFDHAESMAAEVAARLRLPLVCALARSHGADQRALGRGARAANAESAFVATSTPPARPLLVDDVFTTGATLDAAAGALLAAGALRVDAAAVARACRADVMERCILGIHHASERRVPREGEVAQGRQQLHPDAPGRVRG